MGWFSADYCSSRLEHNCVPCLNILVRLKPLPPLLMLSVWKSFSAWLLSYLSISSPRLPIRAHQSERERAAWSRAACSDPALVLEPTHIQTEAFKHSPAVATQQEAQWTFVTSSVSAISTRMRFHYFVKGKRTRINKPNKEDIFSICPLYRILLSIWGVIQCGSFIWGIYLWLLHWLNSFNALWSRISDWLDSAIMSLAIHQHLDNDIHNHVDQELIMNDMKWQV